MKPTRKLPDKMKATQFKPGQSGNPKGRVPLTEGQRALRNLTLSVYQDVLKAVLMGNLAEIKAMVTDPNSPGVRIGVATAFLKAIKEGDYAVIERIAERIIGKIPETINLNTSGSSVTAAVDPMTPEGQLILKAALAKLEADV